MILRRGKTSLAAKAAVVIILFVSLFFFSDTAKNAFFFVSSPVQSFLFQKGGAFYGVTETVVNLSSIREEITDLRKENRDLSARLTLQREIVAENEALRKALDLDMRSEKQFIFSEVSGSNFDAEKLIVASGKKDGVEEGYAVTTPEGSLVGVVSDVFSDFSEVLLITSKESSFEAKVQGEDDYIGVLKGGSDLVLEMLPRESEIEEGDLVSTFSQEGYFPRGIFIGHISKVIDSDVEAFTSAEVRPAFNLHELEFLLIIE